MANPRTRKPTRAVRVTATVRIRARDIVMDRVEQAIACGDRRAHKHTDKPGRDAVVEHIQREVATALDEVLRWEDEEFTR